MAEILVRPEPLVQLIQNELPPNPCWIDPILPKGGTLLFGGPAKTGKSFIMLELARALSTGTQPFGCPKFGVKETCRVLLVEQELGPYGLQKRVKSVFGQEEPEVYGDKMWYVSKVPEMQLDTHRGMMILDKLVSQIKPNILLLDPIGRMNSYDENKSDQIQQLFTYLESVVKDYRDYGLSIVLSHHFGKLSPDPKTARDPLDPYNFRGSSKWFDCPDTLITMARMQDLKTKWKAWSIKTHIETRQDEGPPDMLFSVNRLNDLRVRYEKSYGEDTSSTKDTSAPVMPVKQLRFVGA